MLSSPEPEAQKERLRNFLAHGVKEDLVERVRDWPGLHCAHELRDGKPLEGVWIDRTGSPEPATSKRRAPPLCPCGTRGDVLRTFPWNRFCLRASIGNYSVA